MSRFSLLDSVRLRPGLLPPPPFPVTPLLPRFHRSKAEKADDKGSAKRIPCDWALRPEMEGQFYLANVHCAQAGRLELGLGVDENQGTR